MHLSALFIYPVKSLRGIALQVAHFDELGLVNDRRFLIVEEDGAAITQRGDPSLALIDTALEQDSLLLGAPGRPGLRVPLHSPADPSALLRRSTKVWRASGMLADDCGPEASAWFSAYLGRPAHLVRIGAAFSRPMPVRKMPAAFPHGAPAAAALPAVHATLDQDQATDQRVSFADAFPFLMLGESSLADLNVRIAAAGGTPAPLDRFRTNLVLADAPPYAEDELGRFRIGDTAVFHAASGCSRCILTTTDQATAVRGVEPLRTLAGYRRDPSKPADVLFGQNILHETKSGVLRVGDKVERL